MHCLSTFPFNVLLCTAQSRAEIEVIETFSSSSDAANSLAFTLFVGGNYLNAMLLNTNGTENVK